jgi:hypothetical protein
MSPPQLSQGRARLAEPRHRFVGIDTTSAPQKGEGEDPRGFLDEIIHRSKVGTFPLERADARVLRWIRVHVSTSTPGGVSGGVSYVFGPPRERGEGGARGHNMGERRDGGCRVHLGALTVL